MNFWVSNEKIQAVIEMESCPPTESPARKNGQGGNMKYQDYIRHQDCVGCLLLNRPQQTDTQHHHAFTGGVGMRCPDEYSLPLCKECHDFLHGANQGGKKAFIEKTGMPNFYAPILNYMINYCLNNENSHSRQRTAYYTEVMVKWLQQTNIKAWINRTPYLARSPI